MFKIIGVGSRPGWIRNFFLDPKVVVAWIRIRNKSGFRIRNKSGFTTLLETPQRMEPKVLFLFLLLQLLLLVSIRVGTEIFLYLVFQFFGKFLNFAFREFSFGFANLAKLNFVFPSGYSSLKYTTYTLFLVQQNTILQILIAAYCTVCSC